MTTTTAPLDRRNHFAEADGQPKLDAATLDAIRADVASWPPLDASQLALVARAFAGAVSPDDRNA